MTRHPSSSLPWIVALAAFLSFVPAFAEEPVDLDAVNRIRDEAFHRSQVMDLARQITDGFGARLTGSPQLRAAQDWAVRTLSSWGLAGARLEPWDFGRGWSFTRSVARLVAPRVAVLRAVPEAWSPGTLGPVRGAVVMAPLESKEDLDKFRGKLKGRIVLLDRGRDVETPKKPLVERYTDQELADLLAFEIPGGKPPEWRAEYLKRLRFRRELNRFLAEEGALAAVRISSRDADVVRVGGSGGFEPDYRIAVPTVALSAEGYDLVSRLVGDKKDVELELDVEAEFHEGDGKAFNVIAEIPGTSKKDEVVMIGAHFDSWHAGTGATDNGAGSAVVLEVARILRALDVKPRRTIRVALWSGEEQGLLGSRAYVREHFADRPENMDPDQQALPSWLREDMWPIRVKPEHAKLSAYFNLDNGGGKIRGIYAQENVAVAPVFEAWIRPLRDLGVTAVTNNDTGSTDHVPFAKVGLPGFQFVQDGLDYGTRTHHTDIDTYDYLRREDLMQAAAVMATFAYHAAQRDAMLPRGPMPQPPPTKPEASPSPIPR